MRKKLLVTILALVLALSLTGAASALTYGYIAYQMSDIWNEYSSKAFQYAADQNGVDVVILDSQNDIGKSVAAMESLVQQEVDGISIFPISPEQGAQLIKMANEAGIPITVENIDVAGVSNPEEYVAAVGCLYGDIGYAAIEWLSKNVEDAKVFYCAGAVGGGVFETYKIGVDKALEDFKDDIEMVGLMNADAWSTENGLNLTTNFINSGVEFNCIFANNDQIAQGCYQALQEAGLDIPVVSTGGSPDAYKFLEDGIEAANMTAPVSIQGVQTFKNLHEFVTENKIPDPKFQNLPVIPVSGDDLSAWIDWSDFAGAYDYVYNQQ
ncbi:MAG: sugar ABC transporter substrate-binding protein [Eubacteriales bacterium]|jgi:ABC-type sugar transport system substrate-binding protein|nr:sugar ABC transporter substrate-binding protein [Eubacteriales bacterium]MDD3572285.1 sugar ABC transporter substrate-binding protein [Eubacteriales bacterium]MDD4133712.1 sugar ABC transporter substrate-binding protein [Eubacteriales bacterium]NLO13965.1 sugar ABC transporter substrate-binding protein [Clostridiales bacterium]